jgi:hypothetical protein
VATQPESPQDDDDDDDTPDYGAAMGRADYFTCFCGTDKGFELQLGGQAHGKITCLGCGQEFDP